MTFVYVSNIQYYSMILSSGLYVSDKGIEINTNVCFSSKDKHDGHHCQPSQYGQKYFNLNNVWEN